MPQYRFPTRRAPTLSTSLGYIVFYRVTNGDVIEVVRLLHDAMEVQLHLPND
ncbi:type II toxin-antitoxin system RelE/ParE family toxin [Pseudomonas sp. SWRI111]|uniref:type II toxin-antitoxin system RelE/ParE family toxin n=1 Tax=Pseudomonas sp. SWRI111 TaxID=2745507 RepID=UPI001645714B|nr:type II toxin-antitoxin system RelE/ParE family toxin [Pseudomonas sp. SWRI111]MBC3205302.1 type II toxin-antitoxin system RelE/ParE family toxin [Pseudomonas sp. SWRI111]